MMALEQGNGARASDEEEDMSLVDDGQQQQGTDQDVDTDAWSDQDKAAVLLSKYMFDTPDNKLSQMTETPRRMVVPMSLVEAVNTYIAESSKRKPILLSELWMHAFDKRMRSIDGKHLMRGMAMSQVEAEKEEADRELSKDEL